MTTQNDAAEDRIRNVKALIESGLEDTDSYERLLAEKDTKNEPA